MVERKRPPGIDPHGSGIRIRVQHKGKRYTEIVPGDYYRKSDLTAAVRRREELKSRINLGLPLQPEAAQGRSLFSEDAQAYLNQHTDIDYSTALDYENIINCHWMPLLGNQITQEITREDIKAYLGTLDVTQKRKKNILIPLRGIFDHAGVTDNPAKIKLKKDPKRKIERFRPKERAAIIRELDRLNDPQVSAYFALLLGCGLRPRGEPLGLKWSDYDEETHRLHIQRTIVRRRHKPTTKTHEERKVYVPEWVRPYLSALPTRFEKGWMFINSRGTPHLDADQFNGPWRALFRAKAIKEMNLGERDPYVCRHTRAAEMLSNGVAPGKAAKELGHTLEMFYRTYAEFIEEFQGSGDDELEASSGPKMVQKWSKGEV